MLPNLTPKQRKAVESLLTSGDVSQAAQAAGVTRDTIYRWFKQEHFVKAIQEAERQALEALSRALVALGGKATETLSQAMSEADSPLGVKVRAADIVLGRLVQLRELFSLEDRVASLESELATLRALKGADPVDFDKWRKVAEENARQMEGQVKA